MRRLIALVTAMTLAASACGGGDEGARNVAIPSRDALARLLPADSEGLPGQQASVALDGNSQIFCSITSTGGLVCWGNKFEWGITPSPSRMALPSAAPVTAVSVSAMVMCVVSDGAVHCRGNNSYYVQNPGGDPVNQPGWNRINLPFAAADVAVGTWFACAIGTAGQVACWGSNTGSVLGENAVVWGKGPYVITNLTNVVQVVMERTNACALESGGDVKCWGSGSGGLLGGAPTSDAARPIRVVLPAPVVHLDMTEQNACAALSTGSVWCWGRYTPVYDPAAPVLPEPRQFAGERYRAVSVDVLVNETCIVNDWGEVWCWGSVNGTTRALPFLVTDGTLEVMQIRGSFFRGAAHCLQLWNAAVRCFGNNGGGELGQGRAGVPGISYEPLLVTGLGGVVGGTRLPLGVATTIAPATSVAPVVTSGPATTVTSGPAPTVTPSNPVEPGASVAPEDTAPALTSTTVGSALVDGASVAVTTAVERATTSRVNVRVKKGKSVDFRTIVRHAGLVAPKGAKISVSVPKSSRRTCAISGVRLVGAKPGSCRVTVKVTPKGSRARSAKVVVDIVR